MSELGRIKYLKASPVLGVGGEGAEDEKTMDFRAVDSVLLEIAEMQKKKLAVQQQGADSDDGLVQSAFSSPSSSPTVEKKAQNCSSTSSGSSSNIKVTCKVVCSVPYGLRDRENLVQSAVECMHRMTKQEQRKRKDEETRRQLTEIAAHNRDMDAEVDELQALRSVRQWRNSFMAKMERSTRVNKTKMDTNKERLKDLQEQEREREHVQNDDADSDDGDVEPLDIQSLVDYFMKNSQSTNNDKSYANANEEE